jgi:hypothetical protein
MRFRRPETLLLLENCDYWDSQKWDKEARALVLDVAFEEPTSRSAAPRGRNQASHVGGRCHDPQGVQPSGPLADDGYAGGSITRLLILRFLII